MPRRAGRALILGVALLVGPQSSARPLPPATFLGSVTPTADSADFGGLSAVEITGEGSSLLALGDKGTLFEVSLQRDESGNLAAARITGVRPLQSRAGKPLAPKMSDAEGMDLAPDGSLLVSFEGRPGRIWLYHDGRPQELPSAKAFATLGRNAGIEAVARDASGVIYAIPEETRVPGADFPVFRLRDGTWDRKLAIPRQGMFLPVAADFGPDGRLYLLERKFVSPLGFASRLRRFDLGDGLSGAVTLFETALGVHDNLEGLSVWRDPSGQLRATLVSDDNFMWFLTTRLIEYRLPD
jgi:hypothetical protein